MDERTERYLSRYAGTKLAAILSRYALGDVDWPTTKDALVTFPYGSGNGVGDWVDTEEGLRYVGADGDSWQQFENARNYGVIDFDQYIEVVEARNKARV